MLIPPKITQPFKYDVAEELKVAKYLLKGNKCRPGVYLGSVCSVTHVQVVGFGRLHERVRVRGSSDC
jgi:hypothetical protein